MTEYKPIYNNINIKMGNRHIDYVLNELKPRDIKHYKDLSFFKKLTKHEQKEFVSELNGFFSYLEYKLKRGLNPKARVYFK